MKFLKLATPLAVIAVTSALNATSFSSGAAQSAGFSLADGTDLATGSVVLIGAFSVSEAQVIANATNYSFLSANFIQVDSAFIGKGDPVGAGSTSNVANAGLFSSSKSGVNTTNTGLNVATSTLYYWVFNSATPATATQYGIFGATSWTIPSGDGSPIDLTSLNTDLSDLTVNGAGAVLNNSVAKILFGSFSSTTTNASGGGADFKLAAVTAVPEPSSFAIIAGLGSLAFVGAKRRRK